MGFWGFGAYMSEYAAEYGDTPAAADQDAGSPFLTQLNAGDETPQPASGPQVSYTNIATTNDEIVAPTPTSQFLARRSPARSPTCCFRTSARPTS